MSAADILIVTGAVCVFAALAARWGVGQRLCRSCEHIGDIKAPRSKTAPATNKAPGLPDGARRTISR